MSLIVELLQNIASLVALTVLLQFIERRWRGGVTGRHVLSGLLYGAIVVVGMASPVVLSESGIILDGRSVVLPLAGLFGGPLTALIAAVIAAAYRIWLGGGGTLVGVAVIGEAALIGTLAYLYRKRDPRIVRPLALWAIGLLVHVSMLGLFLLLPGNPLHDILPKLVAPILIAYPAAFVLIGRVLVEQENRHLLTLSASEGSEVSQFLAENTADVIWLMDMDLEFRYINQSVERVFGYTPSQYLGTRLSEHADKTQLRVMSHLIEQSLRALPATDIVTLETELLHKDGHPVPIEVNARILVADDGRALAIYGSSREITDRKHAEELERARRGELEGLVEQRTSELSEANERLRQLNSELRSANEQLTEASEAKSRFMRSMSHELRTPLNSIIGFSNILARGIAGEVNDEQRRQAEMIHHSGEHLLGLINDILDLSRIEADRLELELHEFDLARLCEDVMLSVVTLAAAKGVDMRVSKPANPVTITSDERKVRQILINLVGNAVKFIDRGSITMRVVDAGHGLLAVKVTDTGPGIAPEEVEHIFGEFAQAGDTDEADREGSGLGLAIALGLARALGGTITVKSELGAGSTFTLLLPGESAPA